MTQLDIYDGPSDTLPVALGGAQDDLAAAVARSFVSLPTGQRDTPAAIDWYQDHETTAAIGFNPDGMCQKVCRTARNIDSFYPSAIAQQAATPLAKQVHQVADIQRGMVAFYDDPADSNPYGHIVTVVGRDRHRDPDDLGSLLVRTNSVVSGRLVVVRGDYFPTHWGDRFQFAGTTLNGVDLLLPDRKPVTPPDPKLTPKGLDRLRKIRDTLTGMIERNKDERLRAALIRDRRHIIETIRKYRA